MAYFIMGLVFLSLFLSIVAFILSGGGTMKMAMPHQRAAAPLHILIVVTFGLLAFASIAGGVTAIIYNSKSDTKFSLLGANLSTGDVGVALVGIGLVIAYFTIRAVLKSARDLASLPPDAPRKPRKPKKPVT